MFWQLHFIVIFMAILGVCYTEMFDRQVLLYKANWSNYCDA